VEVVLNKISKEQREQIDKLKYDLKVAYQNQRNIENEIHNLENKLVILLCPKNKEKCEPEYCVFQETNNCEFLARRSRNQNEI